MNQTIQTIQNMSDKVWSWRKANSDIFPWPDDDKNMLFALTELAEVIDAMLREDDTYLRTNKKDMAVEKEIADALAMIMSVRFFSVVEGVVFDEFAEPKNDYDAVAYAMKHVSMAFVDSLDEPLANYHLNTAVRMLLKHSRFDASAINQTLDKWLNNAMKNRQYTPDTVARPVPGGQQ